MDKYTFRTIANSEGATILAVIYDGEFCEDGPVVVELLNNDVAIFQGTLSSDNTSVFFGPLSSNVDYALKIHDVNTVLNQVFSINEDSHILSVTSALQNGISTPLRSVEAAAVTTFSAYTSASATSPLGTYSSLFQAIDRARQAGTGAVVKMNASTEVYRHGQAGRYYKYQFTASYGYTTDPADYNAWLSGYLCTYIIYSSTARFYGCNWTTGKGTPNEWVKEPNSGGYYYQFGFAGGYNKVDKKVLLSQSRLKPSKNASMPFNAYVFVTFQTSSITLDAGIVSEGADGNWRVFIYGDKKTQDGATVCGSTKNSDGEYVANADIQLTVSWVTGKLTVIAKNLSTGTSYSLTRESSLISGSPAMTSSVSFVPGLSADSPITPDYRCEGYFRTVIQAESKIYTTDGIGYDFYATSAKTQYSLRYNTDCCDLTIGSSRDTINIYYDRAYRT